MVLNRDGYILSVLVVVVLANAYDLFVDWRHGVATWHLIEEGAVIGLSLAALTWLMLGLRQQQLDLAQLRRELTAVAQGPATPDPVLMARRRELGNSIREQFLHWQLTSGEREVAMLLLKGFSFKEIAALRGTAEKTVRQQASGIYAKAGVKGRHAFSAWFIEDIL